MKESMKICPRCKLNKNINDYRPSQYKKSGGWCRACCKSYENANKDKKSNYNKEYAIVNKDKISQNRKNNKDRNNSKQRERREKNKETHKILYYPKIREYRKNRRKNDEQFRLRELLSSMIYQALKKQKSSKDGMSISNYLPYSMQELKEHLEKQFESWMNWSNWGTYNKKTWNNDDPVTWKWNIDHIIPQSCLPYSSMKDINFLKCWTLDNLRPLSAKQNLSENNKRSIV